MTVRVNSFCGFLLHTAPYRHATSCEHLGTTAIFNRCFHLFVGWHPCLCITMATACSPQASRSPSPKTNPRKRPFTPVMQTKTNFIRKDTQTNKLEYIICVFVSVHASNCDSEIIEATIAPIADQASAHRTFKTQHARPAAQP